MDQIKIGKFIAECRKKQNLTQSQLAGILHVTDRAVSKWETGRSMPDSSIMLQLCATLKISVNDLLNGEITNTENYYEKYEKTLLEMTKEKQESDKRQLRVEIFVGLISTIFLFSMIYIASLFEMKTWIRCLLIGMGFIIFFIGCIVALILEQKAGYYECKECKHKYVPTFKVILNSPHIGRTRYMKCPNCYKKSWHKKVINK